MTYAQLEILTQTMHCSLVYSLGGFGISIANRNNTFSRDSYHYHIISYDSIFYTLAK